MNGAHAGGVDATKTQAAGAPRPAPVTSDTSPVNQDVVSPVPSVPSELLPFGSLQYDLKQLVYNKYFIHDSLIPVTLGDDPGTVYINQAYMGTYIGDHLRAWVSINGRFGGRVHYKVTLAGASVVIGAIEMGFTHRAYAQPSINQLTLIKRSTVAVNNQQVWTFEIGPNVPPDGIMRCFWNWPLADAERDMLPHFVVINNLPPTNAFNSDALPNLNMRVETKAAMDFIAVCEDVGSFALIADTLTALSASRSLTGQGLRNYYVSPIGTLRTTDQIGSRWNGKTLGEFLGQSQIIVSLDGLYGYNIASDPLAVRSQRFFINIGGYYSGPVDDSTVVYDALPIYGPVVGEKSIVVKQTGTATTSLNQGILLVSVAASTLLIFGDRPTLPASFSVDVDMSSQTVVEAWLTTNLPGAIIQRLTGVVISGEAEWYARLARDRREGDFPAQSTLSNYRIRRPGTSFQRDPYIGTDRGPVTTVKPASFGYYVQESGGSAYYIFPVEIGWSIAENAGASLLALYYPANITSGLLNVGNVLKICALSFDQTVTMELDPAQITFLYSSYLLAPSRTTVVRTPEQSVRVVFTRNIPASVSAEVSILGYPTIPSIVAPTLSNLPDQSVFMMTLQDPMNRESLITVIYNPRYSTFYARMQTSVRSNYAVLNYLDGANLVIRNASILALGNTPPVSKTTKFLDRIGTIDTLIRTVRSVDGNYLSREPAPKASNIKLSSKHGKST